jgi:putative lipoic acid-binding regulatory protein
MLGRMTGPKRAPDRDLLLAQHRFPGEYIIKAFGPGTEAFTAAIRSCATDVVGQERARISERMSARGSRMCVSVTLHANTVDEVIGVYDRIHEVPDLMMIL